MPRQRKLPCGMWQRGDVYYARFRANGREVRERLSTDYRVACQMLNDLRARADKADFGMIDNDYPWAKLRDEFIAWAKQSVRDWEQYARDLRRFESFAPLGAVRDIDEQRIYGYRKWRLDAGKSPRTVNREVGTINNLLNRGVAWKRIAENAIVGIKPLAHDKPAKRRRSLSVEEVERLFAVSPPELLPIWRLFMCSGMRKNELVNLRFSDIDFERKVATVRAESSKSRKAREIPLDENSLEILTELREQSRQRKPMKGRTEAESEQVAQQFSKDHVFVTKFNTPRRNNLLRTFYAICRKAGIEDAHRRGSVDIHSLRVTFTTLALENGAPPKAVQAILGHSTLALTMGVYAKATDRAKRAAVSALPFAAAGLPDHVVSLQNAHRMRTSSNSTPQPIGIKELA